jgi:hypothetical protein
MLKLKIVIVRCHDEQGEVKVMIIIIIKKHENQRENPFSNRKYPIQIILQKLQRPILQYFLLFFQWTRWVYFTVIFLCFFTSDFGVWTTKSTEPAEPVWTSRRTGRARRSTSRPASTETFTAPLSVLRQTHRPPF